MNNLNNVVQINTKVTVPSGALFANPALVNLIEVAKQQAKQLKAQEAALSLIKNEIRKLIGEHTTVIGSNGEIAATYNWIKGSESIDKEALRVHFNDVYEVVRTVGDATRRLELK